MTRIKQLPDQPFKTATNPTISQEQQVEAVREERKRIPMSVARQKLACRDIPGYHTYWFNDYPGRIGQAVQGGYEFVNAEEVDLQSFSLGSDISQSGNTDLGTKVSIVVGKNEDGTPLRAYLMKIKEEWYKEDQKVLQDRCDLVDRTIHRGMLGSERESEADKRTRYLNSNQTSYQHPNRRT